MNYWKKIGSGGMAIVFRAKDRTLQRYVTVKILREEFIGDEEFKARFRSEALAAAKLSHTNIVRVYDVGQEGNVHFIVMEYVHGDTLKQAIKEKALLIQNQLSMFQYKLHQELSKHIKPYHT